MMYPSSAAGDVYTVGIDPTQPEWKQDPIFTSGTSDVTWQQHPAELESFEEFVIWACGFTDPEHPPSQKKWEEFQLKVQELAAEFVAYKRGRRESPPAFTVSTSTKTF